jgi:hypothetical protein
MENNLIIFSKFKILIGNESEYVRISKEKHEPRDDEIGKPDALGHER